VTPVALTGTTVKLVDPRDLLEMLRQHPLATPFNLALYSEQHGRKGLLQAIRDVCSPLDGERLCTADCFQSWEETLSRSLLTNQPVARACPRGMLGFVIPLPDSKDLPDCLIGGGVPERKPAHKPGAENGGMPAAEGMTEAEANRQPSLPEAEAVAEEIFRALPRLLDHQVHTLSLDRTTRRLEAVQKLARDLAESKDSEQAMAIVSEALVVLFNLPRVLIVLQQPGHTMTLHSTLGLAPDTFRLDQKRLADYLLKSSGHPEVLSGSALEALFPGLETRSACVFPLVENENRYGAIAILDVDLHSRDQALIELLVNRMATRLESLKSEEGQLRERQSSGRLVAMVSTLSLVDSRDELYRQILELSAELLTASSGSLMLLDANDGTLKIAAAKGMTSSLAKAMSVSYGEGIAGRVAKSGFPMLVNDIERDKRVATRNRPRFKTKSFVSLPLELENRLLGVLNLADKSNGDNFTEADLDLVQTFVRHAVLMLKRVAILEKAGQFEKMAITDPLTGLYNRRFLENRLQEEFSRSQRQQQSFCLIMSDLDNFKMYNDICGHLAGDDALRKAAQLLRRSARDMDIATRYGGEEFCLILPGTDKQESVFVGERIRRAIESESFPGESHLPLGRLTTSLGIAAFPSDGVNAKELIHAADLALYRAKSLGRNRLVLYESSMLDQALLSHHEPQYN
jgi:diguanylate cyclase (GGDEF)-like protein